MYIYIFLQFIVLVFSLLIFETRKGAKANELSLKRLIENRIFLRD